MSVEINTVTGTISSDRLGRTLMHEHVLIGFPGWQTDTLNPGAPRDEMLAVCRDRIAEMKGEGIGAMIDPCPSDLGRDVEFMATVSAKAGFPIICATGLYKETDGAAPYWKMRGYSGNLAQMMAEVFIAELTEGIGETGVKAGIIKVATGYGRVTDYERQVLEAAALASIETDAPITTHTDDGKLGDEQQAILTGHGVEPHRIEIGHSCGTDDHAYHMGIVSGGSYLGFDRFGIEAMVPDDTRVAALLKVLGAGAASRVMVSHDSVWCWRGVGMSNAPSVWEPTHFTKRIIPKLRAGGATDEQLDLMLVENPRRFFAGDPLPELD